MSSEYSATLDRSAEVITLGVILVTTATLFLLGVLSRSRGPSVKWTLVASGALTALALVGSFALRPRSYIIAESEIVIDRLVSPIVIPAKDIVRVQLLSSSSLGAVERTFGSGGLFGYFGDYRSSELGNFRMYATRRDRLVGLFTRGGVLALSPNRAEDFVSQVEAMRDRQSGTE